MVKSSNMAKKLCKQGFFYRTGNLIKWLPNDMNFGAEKLCRGNLLCCVSESFRWRISLWMRSGESIKIFRRNFLSQSVENFRRGTFSLISGIEKFYASEGYVTISRRKLLSHSTETFRRRTLLCCFGKFPVANKFLDEKRGSIKIFR